MLLGDVTSTEMFDDHATQDTSDMTGDAHDDMDARQSFVSEDARALLREQIEQHRNLIGNRPS